MIRNDRYWGALAIAASGSRNPRKSRTRFDSRSMDLRPILRLIAAGEPPNDYDALTRALASGCIEERLDGRYYLTEQGKRVIR